MLKKVRTSRPLGHLFSNNSSNWNRVEALHKQASFHFVLMLPTLQFPSDFALPGVFLSVATMGHKNAVYAVLGS